MPEKTVATIAAELKAESQSGLVSLSSALEAIDAALAGQQQATPVPQVDQATALRLASMLDDPHRNTPAGDQELMRETAVFLRGIAGQGVSNG